MYTVRQPSRELHLPPPKRAAAVLSLGCAVLLFASAAPAPADEPFVPGSGDAVARVGRVIARASGLPLAVTFGGALGHYQGTTARGEAAALDLGILGVLLTTPMGCGRAILTPDQLPKRTVADSAAGETAASKDVAGHGPVGAGREEAAARPNARGEASFTSASLALGDLVTVGDGRSSTAAELVGGQERNASARVQLGRLDLAGGLVSLRGLRWAADQQTGPGGAVLGADGSFGVDTVVVAGLPLPTATPLDLVSAFGAANALIAPFGLRLEPPQVTKATADREVRVTPLKLVLGDGTAAKPLLGPLMSNLQPAREALLEAMQRFRYGECGAGNGAGLAFTFVDVVAAAMGGSGGIDLELGGVLATTEGVDYGDPFGLIPPGLPTVAPVVAPAVRPSPPAPGVAYEDDEPLSSGFDPGSERFTPASAEVAAPVAAAAPPSGEPVAALPATRRCESTSRGRVAGCSRGAPLQASAAALGLAVVLFGGDWWRTRRRFPTEVQR